MDFSNRKPRVLVSNDDGTHAPGLRALAAELHKQDFCELLVCGPSSERSAQSHAISLGKAMVTFSIEVEGALEAYAVDGTPADSVMLALNSPLFKDRTPIDLVVSGINRGDNAGLHVIYSGTVGAAREAATQGIAAIAVSLDSYTQAKTPEDFAAAAKYTVAFIKAVLGLLPGSTCILPELQWNVANLNVPAGEFSGVKGMYLASQSISCIYPAFREVTHEKLIGNAVLHHGQEVRNVALETDLGTDGIRAFKHIPGEMKWDHSMGTDSWAVKEGWVSVTPLGLRQDVKFGGEEVQAAPFPAALAAAITAASTSLGVAVGGTSKL